MSSRESEGNYAPDPMDLVGRSLELPEAVSDLLSRIVDTLLALALEGLTPSEYLKVCRLQAARVRAPSAAQRLHGGGRAATDVRFAARAGPGGVTRDFVRDAPLRSLRRFPTLRAC